MCILAVLLGALGLFGLAVRKGWILQNMTGLQGMTGPRRRLAIKETLVIDPRRRLVILQTDGTEHVVLLGANGETILDSQPAPAPTEPPTTGAPADALASRPAPTRERVS